MPAQRKHQVIQCQYFPWRLFQRNHVWYADGRFEDRDRGKHSLGTRDRAEANESLRRLDFQTAVECGLARDTGIDPDKRLEIARGWSLYLAHCDRPEVMGGVSRKTLNKYKRSRDLHSEFCSKHRVQYWNDLGKSDLEGYGRSLNAQFALRSLYFELTQIKTVINWLVDENHLPPEARFRFRLSKPEGSETYCYSPKQVSAMLEVCDADDDLTWLGNIIRVLACTGLRIGELASLRRTDIDLDANAIVLTDERASHRRTTMGNARRTKGKRGRTIPLHTEIRPVICGLPDHRHGLLLCGPRGGKVKVDRARERLVDSVITPLTAKFPTPQGEIGFEHGRFHSFRHYFISQAFASGATEAEIMSWVGHKDSKTVAIYRHLRNEDAQRRMKQISFIRQAADPDGPEQAA